MSRQNHCGNCVPNLGQNIDIVVGIFDETMLDLRSCDDSYRSPGDEPAAISQRLMLILVQFSFTALVY